MNRPLSITSFCTNDAQKRFLNTKIKDVSTQKMVKHYIYIPI